jgi:S1-C subfamily serine protease
MFADAVAKLTASIFPIFFAYERDDGPIIGVSGTGFFADDSGLFVTVDHIMNCAPAGSTYYYYGNLPDQLSRPAVEIERVASDPGQDLYLGRVGRDYLRAVELASEAVRPGDAVCLSGYPMAEVSLNAAGGFVANVRRYWQPTFVVDATQAVVDGRVYDGYLVGHPCFAGMSGGPVFDVEGKVRGMAVATLTRTEPEFKGDPTVVRNGIVLDVAHIRVFVEQHRPAPASVGRQRGPVTGSQDPARARSR